MKTSRIDGVKAPQHRGTPRSHPFVTMNWARSPHVFDDGVTLTMSPSRSFASA